ncbi:rna polymerase sigma factor [Novosphingobium sp. Rr 2-17]|nr:rna polymerase sigma factor [Novosphingobium sp. Rr 2-17]
MTAEATFGTVESLYVGHGEWLTAWLERRLRCPDWAAQISQDTFCRLLERLPEAAPSAPRSYLVTIARRLLIDDVRRRAIERTVLDTHAIRHATVEYLTPERILEAVQFLDQVLALIEALPEATRKVLLLRRLEGYSHQEIADALGMSARTVRRHIVTATMRMYALLSD